MKIWVDADACPGAIKEMLFRAAERTATHTTLIANHPMRIAAGQYVHFMQVEHGFDVADNEIVKRLSAGDLVITADIPLASESIDKGAVALNPRGELYTTDNIKSRLAMRDFMDTLRGSGMDVHSGPPPLSQADKQAFANHLDRILAANPK